MPEIRYGPRLLRDVATNREAAMALSLALAGVMLFLADFRATEAFSRPRRRRAAVRAVRKVCAGCERQRATLRSHGIVTWPRFATLCRRCRVAACGHAAQSSL